jgi:hypothetical protein
LRLLRPDLRARGTPLVPLVALSLCLGVAIGILAIVSLPAAVAVAVVVAIVAFARGRLSDLAGLALILAVGVPLTAAGQSADTFLSIPLGSIHPPFQIVLVVGVAVLAVLLATDQSLSHLVQVLRRGASGTVVLWLMACSILLLLGVGRNGFATAGRQFMFLSVYVWIVPVIIFSRERAEHALRSFLALTLVGVTLCGLYSLTIFAVAPLRQFFFAATQWADSVRIYFGNTSAYVLLLPVALLLAGSKAAGRLRLLGLVSALFMVASMMVSQTRAVIVACVFNVVVVILVPGMWRLGVRRWRILGIASLLTLLLVAAIVTAGSLGVRSAAVLPQELSHRFSTLVSVSDDTNYQTRLVTNEMAMSRWLESPTTVISGRGLGAPIGYYDPGSATPYDVTIFVDNAWATLAVQGGLIALAAFALMLVGAFVSFVRVARLPIDSTQRLMARALVLSFPAFAFESTMTTSHLLLAPGVVVALCTLLAAADAVWWRHRGAGADAVDVAGDSPGSGLRRLLPKAGRGA